MKRVKLDNKGFSLVELIIVIAIMAILAAALAPQLVQYLEEARESSDHQVTETIIGCFNAAIADDDVYKELTANTSVTTFDITFDNSGSPQMPTSDFPLLAVELEESLADIEKPKTSGTTKYTVSWNNSSNKITGVNVSTT